MELKNRTLSNFAELVQTGECKKFRGRLKVGVDLGTPTLSLQLLTATTVLLPELPHLPMQSGTA